MAGEPSVLLLPAHEALPEVRGFIVTKLGWVGRRGGPLASPAYSTMKEPLVMIEVPRTPHPRSLVRNTWAAQASPPQQPQSHMTRRNRVCALYTRARAPDPRRRLHRFNSRNRKLFNVIASSWGEDRAKKLQWQGCPQTMAQPGVPWCPDGMAEAAATQGGAGGWHTSTGGDLRAWKVRLLQLGPQGHSLGSQWM